jgi:glutathione peroxidase
MKKIGFIIVTVLLSSFTSSQKIPASIHSIQVKDINGDVFDFSSLLGKKIMIVNTASKCGLTPQYEMLEALYQKYRSNDFVIVGFPSNDFANQEPGTNAEISEFCTKNFGVSFPLMEKVSVKGKNRAEVYRFLTKKKMNGIENSTVKWNFQKYLLDENGVLVKVIGPTVRPDDSTIINWIEQ